MRILRKQLLCSVLLFTVAQGSLPAQRQVAIPAYPVEGLQYDPMPVVFTVVTRGGVTEASIEITNQRATPLKIGDIINPSERFTARVETLEEGKRFRFVVSLKGEGPAGKKMEIVEIKTNWEDAPVMRIPVNTFVREKVRTFPDQVFMGRYGLSDIKDDPGLAKRRSQILMVYRDGRDDFEAQATSDVPFLKIRSERGPKGDRFEYTIWIDPDVAQPGEIKGNIIIETNDPDFPKVSVPVTGKLLPK